MRQYLRSSVCRFNLSRNLWDKLNLRDIVLSSTECEYATLMGFTGTPVTSTDHDT